MSNLGGYQVMTKLAKKVGGPKNLMILTLGSGYLLFRVVEAGGRKCVKIAKKHLNKKEVEYYNTDEIYEVTTDGKSEDGLELSVGDKYRVIESDGEAIIIEKIGGLDNPYFVSIDFLKTISNFER
ncbi:hypothetical protein R0131_06290 [Clostridium sp. AL.422]|uniref:hypothetical protein n=1 Tax=Clostridium TaxID=1485 RepID=UPI00293DE149|nr:MULTISPECIES: hypothetical protein [unclassified Clostridium]MDV4150440.1 hypothetical protein [Clostridium sp. AL.422]